MDKTDRGILKALRQDNRQSWQRIGQKVHLTGQAVSGRAQQLVAAGVIARFTIQQGMVEGVQRHFVTLLMHAPQFDTVEKLLADHPQVNAAFKVAGEGCYHIELITDTVDDLGAFLRQLDRFGQCKVLTALKPVA